MKRMIGELEKHDKHMAAVHEAGHLTAALAAGIQARARLVRTNTTNLKAERLYTGQTDVPTCTMTPMIALAGIVAECWESDRNIYASRIVQWI